MEDRREILNLAVEIGEQLLRNGGEIYRVEDTILHILDAFHIENADVYVLSNGIFASADTQYPYGFSILRHIPLGEVHLGKIAALNQLSRELCTHSCSIKEAQKRLKECKNLPTVPSKIQALSYGFGCACFSYLFGGKMPDFFCTFLLCILLQYFRIFQKKRNYSKFITNIASSAFLTAGSLIFLHLGLPVMPDKIASAGMIPLLPGIALTSSIRNVFNGDYLSGVIHLSDAVLTAVCIAIGVGTIITIYRRLLGGVI